MSINWIEKILELNNEMPEAPQDIQNEEGNSNL